MRRFPSGAGAVAPRGEGHPPGAPASDGTEAQQTVSEQGGQWFEALLPGERAPGQRGDRVAARTHRGGADFPFGAVLDRLIEDGREWRSGMGPSAARGVGEWIDSPPPDSPSPPDGVRHHSSAASGRP